MMYKETIKHLETDPVNSVVIKDAILRCSSFNITNVAVYLDNAGTV